MDLGFFHPIFGKNTQMIPLEGWAPRTWIRGDRITPICLPWSLAIWKGNPTQADPQRGLTSR